MRASILLLLSALSASRLAFAQPIPAPIPVTATVTEGPLDDGRVSIELTNQGSQTIVAWGLRLEERTPDGKTAASFVANDAAAGSRAHIRGRWRHQHQDVAVAGLARSTHRYGFRGR
jgi:hypothetical protein